MKAEDFTSVVDGSLTGFDTELPYIPGSLRVFLDGIRMRADDDYVETSVSSDPSAPSTGFLMTVPVPAGSSLVAEYDVVSEGVLTASGT